MLIDTRASVATNARRQSTSWFYLVLHSQSERELSDWTAYREVTIASHADALSGTNAADAAFAVAGAGPSTQSNASRPLCVLRHRRKHSNLAPGPSGCGALLAQDGEQSELGRRGWMEAVPSNPFPVSTDSTQAVSSLLKATGSRHAVNQPPKSVVRQICTLRSVGAGGGQLPPATRGNSKELSLPRPLTLRFCLIKLICSDISA